MSLVNFIIHDIKDRIHKNETYNLYPICGISQDIVCLVNSKFQELED